MSLMTISDDGVSGQGGLKTFPAFGRRVHKSDPEPQVGGPREKQALGKITKALQLAIQKNGLKKSKAASHLAPPLKNSFLT